MSRLFYHVMQDNAGNLLFDVSGTMRISGTGTLATIYGDEGLTVILPNPMTNHPSFGSFKCFLPAGLYDFYMAKAGYTFETLPQVQGWGTMAMQNANAVAITGGTAVLTSAQATQIGAGRTPDPSYALAVGTLPSHFQTAVTMATTVTAQGALTALRAGIGPSGVTLGNTRFLLQFPKATETGVVMQPTDVDVGAPLMIFKNAAGGTVGSIDSNATTTAYGTTSDARLKHDVEALTGELDLLKQLRPVRFRWLADDSPGVGFLAGEVAAHVPGVVSGEEGAVNDEGQIVPQMIDYSKFVPYLIGAVKALTQQVESLTARLAAAGA